MKEYDKETMADDFAEAKEHGKTRESLPHRKPVLQMVIFGVISLTGYIVLFSNERLITTEFTMGGWHAAYPVLTALLFSFIHGAFASNLLSVLGLEAKKK
jgi:hypothetical protein